MIERAGRSPRSWQDLPRVSGAEAATLQNRREMVERREQRSRAIASTTRPGGLDVYARPTRPQD